MSLRERKKHTTRETILACARNLFLEKGYGSTSMEMIAESSQVAVGTIYNYFGSKALVMIAINTDDTDNAIVRFTDEQLEENTVQELIWMILEVSFGFMEKYPRELMRELFAVSISNHRSDLAQGLSSQDERFLRYLTELLGRLKEKGRLKVETDPETVAFSIYSLVFGATLWYMADDNTDIEKTKNLIASMIGQFCRGILPEGSF